MKSNALTLTTLAVYLLTIATVAYAQITRTPTVFLTATLLAHIGLIPTALMLITATRINFPGLLPRPISRLADYFVGDASTQPL